MIEKRHRDSINCKFLRLKDVLSRSCGSENIGITPHKTSKQMNRAAILEEAHDEILNLRSEVESVNEAAKSLRDAIFPDTCKFTL